MRSNWTVPGLLLGVLALGRPGTGQVRDAGPVGAAIFDAAAAVREVGPLHVPAVRIPAGDGEPESYVALVGGNASVASAWLVAPGAPRRGVLGWPAGVRVLGTAVRTRRAYLLVESLAVMDQPAGVRAVIVVRPPGGSFTTPAVEGITARHRHLLGIRDPAELARRVETIPDNPFVATQEPSQMIGRLFTAPQRAPRQFPADVLPSGGVQLYRLHQGLLYEPTGVLTLVDFRASTSSPVRRRAEEILRRVTESSCYWGVCSVSETGHADSLVVAHNPSGPWELTAVMEGGRLPVRPAMGSAPQRAVQVSPDVHVTTATCVHDPTCSRMTALAEAPLGGGGTIGVVRATTRFFLVTSEAGTHALHEIAADDWGADPNAHSELRFADVDGDSRTDVVVWTPGTPPNNGVARVYLAPPPGPGVVPDVDEGTVAALRGSVSADDAVRRALAVAPVTVRSTEACAAIAPLRRLGGSTVPIMEVVDTHMPAITRAAQPGSRAFNASCDSLACVTGRSYCTAQANNGREWFWFRRNNARLELVAAGFHEDHHAP